MSASSTGSIRGGSGEMFDGIAPRYDFLNRVISMGIDRSWRRQAVAALALESGDRVLDVATGTGDVAIEVSRQLRALSASSPVAAADPGTVVGIDPAARMLAIAENKVAAQQRTEVTFRQGNGESLPFEGDSFDGLSIAFGIRNVPDREKALQEMARVTRPGRRVAILELSEPKGGPLSGLARFHIHTVVPALGAMLSGSREYRYLQQSIAAFPAPEAFSSMMEAAGLRVLEARPLTFGVCHLFVGEVQPARVSA